ncbi:hypothetical protein LOD99_9240 [Oopsacas minuta]|uniref:Uncharacterized protein n=1 Tax=Oopsacas minuta TaxID=111878 RepID=A0AAV7JD16_9METZ|nr:hypothetical protein LOD99_9240 [Oopsacas minuta]
MQQHRLLAHGQCKCGSTMRPGTFAGISEGRGWRYLEKACKKFASMRIRSFAEGSNLPLTELLEFVYFWSENLQTTAFLKELGLGDLPVSIFTEFLGLYDDEDGANSDEVNDHDCEYDVDFQGPSSEPSLFNQAELNDLIRDLDLSRVSSKLLASRLKKRIYSIKEQSGLVLCPNVDGLPLAKRVPKYNPSDWRLFIDSSKRNLKCVLLHNGNIFGSIPIGYSVKLKEEYNNVKEILEIINYSVHDWVICVDLKMVNFLLGQQSGFTKYPCFLCYWDSRDRNQHWIREKWPPRECLKVGGQKYHLDRFPDNLGDMSEEQGEGFHQDINVMEQRYQGRWDTHMMADYCWCLKRDCPNEQHSRKSNKRKFLD